MGDGNLNKFIFPHLNINSIRNKFEFEDLIGQVKGTFDVLMIIERKIDDVSQLHIS